MNHVRQGIDFANPHNSLLKRPSSQTNNHAPGKLSFIQYMMPSEDENFVFTEDGNDCGGSNVNDNMQGLVEETLDVLESDDCNKVMSICLDTAFAHISNNIAPFFQSEDHGEI